MINGENMTTMSNTVWLVELLKFEQLVNILEFGVPNNAKRLYWFEIKI